MFENLVPSLLIYIGVLVALTNIVTEVVKNTFVGSHVHANVIALIASEVLTIAGGVAYCQVYAYDFSWYIGVGLVILGFMVAYAAMFGFDKLKEVMNWGAK